MRLDKLLAHSGFGSRKDVKQIIKKGHVRIDDQVIRNSNGKVDITSQEVTVYGELVQYTPYIYLMLHKPAGYITATEDDYHQTVLSLIPDEYSHYAVSPVGRLDKDTEGLLILTNDGQMNHVLTSPKRNVPKTYFAIVDGTPTEDHIELFTQGVILDDGYETKPAQLEILLKGSESEIMLTITEGKFHQVKRMFQAIGMNVTYLKRLTMGDIRLDDDLLIGQVRELTLDELQSITSLKSL